MSTDSGLHALRGTLVDFSADPHLSGSGAMRHVEDGLLVVRDGLIAAAGPAPALLEGLPPGTPVADHRGHILMPGFVDAHIHYPQTDIIASHGKQLMDWLHTYTFPAEGRFADIDYARGVAGFFLDELLRNGTTTAAVYPTVHKHSAEVLFEAAQARRMRLITGKVMMDTQSPDFLSDSAQSSYDDSAELIERWHGRDRLVYAVTPRFVVTSSKEQLRLAARLLDQYPDVRMQTHIAENHAEIRLVAELFPDSRDYLGVYEDFGLVRRGALFGHCIHFDASAWARFAAAGAVAVHCPTSNLFLGSGLFDIDAARNVDGRVALATDVGGGTSFSMLQTLNEAYKVAQMGGHAFTSLDGFYLATLGGAKGLGLDAHIGNFEPGKEADIIALDPAATPLLAHRTALTRTLEEKLFALMVLGDDRAVAATWVLGRALKTPT
jgi:guanine deaminase